MASSIEQILEETWQLAAKAEKPAVRSISYAEIAEAYLKTGKLDRCLAALELALKSADSIRYPDEKGKQLAWIARLYAQAGDAGKAREQFTRATLLARAAETGNQRAGAFYRIASEYIDAGLSGGLEKIISLLYDIAIDPSSEVDSAFELINVAELYLDSGWTNQAKVILEEALNVTAELKDNWFRAERLIDIAEIYAEIGQAEKSFQLLNEAVTVVSLIDEANHPYFLLRTADLYTTLDKENEANKALDAALEYVNREELSDSRAGSFIEIARKYLELEDIERVQELLAQAVTSTAVVENKKEQVIRLIDIASLLGEMGQRDQALANADQTLSLCKSLTDKKSIPFMFGKIAVLYSELKAREQALQTVSLIIQTVEENHLKTGGLGAIVTDLVDSGEAELALKLALIIREPDIRVHALTRIVMNNR